MSRSAGHCMVMGTASTMASMGEALGMALPGNAAIPAADSRRLALAEMAGRRAVEMARRAAPSRRRSSPPRPSTTPSAPTWPSAAPPTPSSTWWPSPAAPGCRCRLTRFDELSRSTPFLVNLRPSGKYLMEDFFYAGGLPVVLSELLPLLHGDALTVNGHTLAENVRGAG